MSITIKRTRGTIELCTDMALQTEWERRTSELQQLKQHPDRRLGDPVLTAKAHEITALEDRMAESTVVFELEALNRKQWNEFEAKHPADKEVQMDTAFGVHVATFVDDVYSNTPTIVGVTNKVTSEPVAFDAATEWQQLANEMTDGVFSKFAIKLFEINRGGGGAPFSRDASLMTRYSEESSS
jgi:hypothetical protein